MIPNHIDALAALVLTGAAIVGGKVTIATTELLADSNGVQMPDWVATVVGPLGAVVALGYGLKWMDSKLKASENRLDQREAERTSKLEQVERRADERELEYKTFINTLQERNLSTMEHHAEKLEVLTHASIKITAKVAGGLDALVTELRRHPCGKTLPLLTPIEDDEHP